MSKATQVIVEQASQLSASEKIELIDALLASVDKPDTEIDALWTKEAEDRLKAYGADKLKVLDLNQVLAKYR